MSSLKAPFAHSAFIAGSLYWLTPGHFTLAVTSRPAVDYMSIIGMATLWLLCYGLQWRSTPRRGLVTLFLISLVPAYLGHMQEAEQGLRARYFENAEFAGEAAPSWAASCEGCTRVDRQIAFDSHGYSFNHGYFPLFFANDSRKRPWSPDGNNDTDNYRFSAEWDGYIWIPEGKSLVSLELKAEAGQGTLELDDQPVATSTTIAAGPHAIRIRFARTADSPPSLGLYWNLGEGTSLVPASAYSQIQGVRAHFNSSYFMYAGLGAWLVSLGALLALAKPSAPRPLHLAAWLMFVAIFGKALKDVAKDAHSFGYQILGAGNDFLVYETYAREILNGDFLSRIESPFVFLNFGYRYFLAFTHWLAGESPADASIFQQALMALVLVCSCAWAKRLYGRRTAFFLALAIVVFAQLMKLSEPLLDTVWSIAFSAAALFALIHYGRTPRWPIAVIIGATMGVAILLRPNFIPLLALAVAWMLVTHRRWPQAITSLAFSIVFISLLGLRNWLVGGEWHWLPSNGLTNLWIGNHPSVYDGPTYFTTRYFPDRPEIVTTVIDYIKAEPGEFLERTKQKVLFLAGIDIREKLDIKPKVLLPWLVAIVGTFMLWRNKMLPRAELAFLWLWIALLNAPLVVIFPWGYGWRLSAPSFIALYLLCSLTLTALSTRYNRIDQTILGFKRRARLS